MSESAQITVNGKTIECPIVVGSEGGRAIDIAKLRSEMDIITLDPGFSNTGACKSFITFLDGDKGILRYRGYPIEQLAANSTFIETSYLLIHGKLPNQKELDAFSNAFNEHSMIHEDMKHFLMLTHPHHIRWRYYQQ